MRYSIVGASRNTVMDAGGKGVKEAHVSKIIFADMSESQASKLRGTGCTVEKLDKVKASTIAPPREIPSVATYTPEKIISLVGIDDLRAMASPPMYGQRGNIAIIDSGIRRSHVGLRGQVVYNENFSGGPDGDALDHGTGIASIISAVVPLCGILDIKVLDDDGEGNAENVVDAFERCMELQESYPIIAPDIINISMGSPDIGNPNDILRVICRAAHSRGILVVAAAGNDGPKSGSIMSPACDDSVLAVGSAKVGTFEVSDFSSRGPTKEGLVKPDLVMFGEDIEVASSKSDVATVPQSGTSYASPFVAAVYLICLNLEDEEYLRPTVDGIFPQFCVKPSSAPVDKDDNYGYGIVSATQLSGVYTPKQKPVLPSAVAGLVEVGVVGAMMKLMIPKL